MAGVKVTTGGRDYVGRATALLSAVFDADPVITYMLSSLTDARRRAYLGPWFRALLTAAALNDGAIDEAGGWAACAVWMAPGRRVDNPWTYVQAGGLRVLWVLGFRGVKRMLVEFQAVADRVKARELAGRRFYYLFFTGTALDQRRKGLASALIRRYQETARDEGLPIWLEATTPGSCRLYVGLGFRVVQEIVLGKGTAGPDGRPQAGGEGVKVWAMIWEPSKGE